MCHHAKPTDKSFADIVALVQEHHHPPTICHCATFSLPLPLPTAGRVNVRAEEVTEHCNFGDTLNDMSVWDCLVCGVNDQRLQQRLLAEPTLKHSNWLRPWRLQIGTPRTFKRKQQVSMQCGSLTKRKDHDVILLIQHAIDVAASI